MADEQWVWTEKNSTDYRRIAAVAVPARDEQLATLLTLLPFGRDDTFHAVELASGEGALSWALLDCWPRASVLALDGSAQMRAHAGARLKRFAGRVGVEPFDLASPDWLPKIEGADCVLSSLCVHHLDGEGKRRLFAAVAARLSPRGVFLIADLIAPQRPEAGRLFAAGLDRAAEAQSLAVGGSLDLFEQFSALGWNWFRHPDPFDKPSPLPDQLVWLREAGFGVADCFWLQAGHAIYGGYKSFAPPDPPLDPEAQYLTLGVTLGAARAALQATAGGG